MIHTNRRTLSSPSPTAAQRPPHGCPSRATKTTPSLPVARRRPPSAETSPSHPLPRAPPNSPPTRGRVTTTSSSAIASGATSPTLGAITLPLCGPETLRPTRNSMSRRSSTTASASFRPRFSLPRTTPSRTFATPRVMCLMVRYAHSLFVYCILFFLSFVFPSCCYCP